MKVYPSPGCRGFSFELCAHIELEYFICLLTLVAASFFRAVAYVIPLCLLKAAYLNLSLRKHATE